MSTLHERLRRARVAAGFEGPKEAAASLGISRSTYTQHENGIRGFTRETAVQYAKKFKVSLDWLLDGRGQNGPREDRNRLLGRVGAGAEVHRFPEGATHLGDSGLPDDLPAGNVVEIEGDSQYPLQPGWLIVYGPENQGVRDALIGKLCVVQVVDGPTLLKTLKRGSKKGFFRLESWNAPPREDVRLAWAAKVLDIRPT